MGNKILKNIDIINVANSLAEIMKCENLNTKVGWNLGKNLRKLQPIIKDYNEYKKELLEKYAIKEKDGSIALNHNDEPEIFPDVKLEYLKKEKELLECENEVEFLKVPLSEFENKKIPPYLLFNIECMIDEDI